MGIPQFNQIPLFLQALWRGKPDEATGLEQRPLSSEFKEVFNQHLLDLARLPKADFKKRLYRCERAVKGYELPRLAVSNLQDRVMSAYAGNSSEKSLSSALNFAVADMRNFRGNLLQRLNQETDRVLEALTETDSDRTSELQKELLINQELGILLDRDLSQLIRKLARVAKEPDLVSSKEQEQISVQVWELLLLVAREQYQIKTGLIEAKQYHRDTVDRLAALLEIDMPIEVPLNEPAPEVRLPSPAYVQVQAAFAKPGS